MPFFAHPNFIADRTSAYRLDPRPEQAQMHEYGRVTEGVPSRYVPWDGPLPSVLAEAVADWPGPCAHWPRYCDDTAHAEPMPRPSSEVVGADFPPEGYAANAARLAVEQAAADAAAAQHRADSLASDEAVAAWFAANVAALAADYVAERAACAHERGRAADPLDFGDSYAAGFPQTAFLRTAAQAAGALARCPSSRTGVALQRVGDEFRCRVNAAAGALIGRAVSC